MNRKRLFVASGAGALGLLLAVTVAITAPTMLGAAESQEQVDAELAEWNREVGKKVSAGTTSWGAVEIPEDASVLQTELVKLDVDKVVDASDPAAAEKRAVFKGKYELKIYLSDGSVQTVGPFDKKPKRAEVTPVEVSGKASKAFLIEE